MHRWEHIRVELAEWVRRDDVGRNEVWEVAKRIDNAYEAGEEPDDTDMMLVSLYAALYAVRKDRGAR